MQRLRRLIVRAYTFDHPHEALVSSKRMLRRTALAVVVWLAASLLTQLIAAGNGVTPDELLVLTFVHEAAGIFFAVMLTALAIRGVLARHHRDNPKEEQS